MKLILKMSSNIGFNRTILLIVPLMIVVGSGCAESFLDYRPKGTIDGSQLNTPQRVNKMVTAAYAALGNDHWTVPYESMWAYGSVRSDDAYKGGGGLTDQGGFYKYEVFTYITPSQPKTDNLWYRLYVGVQRANDALKRLEKMTDEEMSNRKERIGEVRFIRGHFYFLLKILFKHIPWITEDMTPKEIKNTSNVEFTSQELWDKIAADFKYAAEHLPVTQSQIGRISKYEAIAYLAKTRLYQAYVQNERNQVVDINKDLLQRVVDLTNKVINSGKYTLFNKYAKNFLWKYENGKEIIFSIQRSINDGTPQGRVGMGVALNYPMGGGYGCCGFHQPSQNLVNAFKTNSEGVPMFTTFNETDMKDSNTVDPRLDHTVAISGQPWKPFATTNVIYHEDWARVPGVYGVYSSMKEAVPSDCSCLTEVGPFVASSKNTIIIRYADVLLWKAEALIELGRQNEALPIINRIRMRAKHSKVKYDDSGKFVSNYNIEKYKPGVNIQWTQENARKALRWERRLEFAMEGYRFFDLVRWGIAAKTMNEYFEEEQTKRAYLQDAHFTKGRDEYLPIPQKQIEFSKGLYEQNPGWN